MWLIIVSTSGTTHSLNSRDISTRSAALHASSFTALIACGGGEDGGVITGGMTGVVSPGGVEDDDAPDCEVAGVSPGGVEDDDVPDCEVAGG